MTRLFVLATVVTTLACGGSNSAGPGGPANDTKPKAPSTAEEVLEASIAAQGGRERFAKLTGLRATGTISIGQLNVKGKVTLTVAPPRNAIGIFEMAGLGKAMQGVKDDVAWELNPMAGARIVTGPERDRTLLDAEFNGDIRWKELYPKVELAGVVDFGGVQSYKVVMTSATGIVKTRYFAKDTLLPTGSESVAKTQMGDLPSSSIDSDYRTVDGLQLAHKLVQKTPAVTLDITFEKIELSPPIEPGLFDLPPEIQALQKQQPAPAPAN